MFQLIEFSIGILIQACATFHLVFHKGGEKSYFIFQLVFGLPLVCFPLPNFMMKSDWKKNLIVMWIWYHMLIKKNIFIWYQDVICLLKIWYQFVFVIYWYQVYLTCLLFDIKCYLVSMPCLDFNCLISIGFGIS